jgi:GT2 family glycosyltransferase
MSPRGSDEVEPKVVAVIPNWNGKEDTLECLGSLAKQSYQNLEIMVVDNGSRDGSAEAIRDQFPAVKLICNDDNLGIVVAENQGITYALEKGTDYIAILNNDTTFDPHMFRELVRVAETDEHVAVTGPKMYYYDEPDVIWTAGGTINFTEVVGKPRGYGQRDRGQYNASVNVDYIPSCAVLVKASVVREIGLLDPEYFAYFDETDWFIRMRQRGYFIRYVPTAQMWHKVSRTSGGYSPQGCYALGINAVVFMKKYARWYQWVKWFFFAVLSLPFLYVVRVFQGKGKSVWAKALGIRDGFRGIRVTAETFRRQW